MHDDERKQGYRMFFNFLGKSTRTLGGVGDDGDGDGDCGRQWRLAGRVEGGGGPCRLLQRSTRWTLNDGQ